MTPAQTAAFKAIEDAIQVLKISLEPVVTPPAPPPPIEPPAPPPIPTTGVRTLLPSATIVFTYWHSDSRYERFQRAAVIPQAPNQKIGIMGFNGAAGGIQRVLSGAKYKLLFDGVVVSEVVVAAGAKIATFDVDTSLMTNGWKLMDLDVMGTGETVAPFYICVGAGNDKLPVSTGSYDVFHHGRAHRWALLDNASKLAPQPKPLLTRECPVFDTAIGTADLFREAIVPLREGDIHRINKLPNDVLSTFNQQAYFWHHLVAKLPSVPLLDGPRGVGTFQMATHIQVDRHGGAYCADPWRIVRVSEDGSIRTRCGYRHKSPHTQWGTTQELELLGDWSAIPVERRGFHEIWGFAWDVSSLTTNPSAPPIGGEQPHITGPKLYVADTQNNRIVLLTFSKDSFEDEPVVTEFATGLADPWDCVWKDNILYVSERKAHKISRFDTTTGAKLPDFIVGQALSSVDANRFHWRNNGVTQAQLDAAPCVGPEGLYILDNWLYYGSKAMGTVKRTDITTKTTEIVCRPALDGNSNFIKFAVSDGTFGPKGTVFASTWSIANYGMPSAYVPGGGAWYYNKFDNITRGRNTAGWGSMGYASAVGVGKGRLYSGSSEEGLARVSKALPSDPNIYWVESGRANYEKGRKDYINGGYELLNGQNGYGHFGLPLPWGKTKEMDYYLVVNGHVKPNETI